MPKAYPPDQKQEALRLLAIHNDNVSIVHNLTKIPRSTLYYWRSQEPSCETDTIGQKNIPSPIESVEQTESPPPSIHPDITIMRNGGLTYYRLPDGQVLSKLPARFLQRPLQNADGEDASFQWHEELPDPDSEAAARHKDRHLSLIEGVPGKSYPYPLEEEEEESQSDFEDFRKVREILMNHAQRLAANLKPDEPDINRRSLALSRILDSIAQLDEMLPDLNPERLIRFEYVYNGSVHNVPPWADDDLKYMNKIKDLEKQLAEALEALNSEPVSQPAPADAPLQPDRRPESREK